MLSNFSWITAGSHVWVLGFSIVSYMYLLPRYESGKVSGMLNMVRLSISPVSP